VPRLAGVARTVEVAVDPLTAFEVFTAEIGDWYVGGPWSWNDPERAVGIRIEPGVGGRWVEVWDEATGDGFEIGRVLAWEPGRRLLVSYRSRWLPPEPPTEIEVRFTPVDAGTRVVLEHRGLDRLPPDVVARFVGPHAWAGLLGAYTRHVAARA
jgi:uncharacterized protein YndB with AHSA1/START domain